MSSQAIVQARYATWSLALGALALVLAILPTFILPITHPDPPAINRIGETATEIRQRLAAMAQGREYQAPATAAGERARWSRYASLGSAVAGLLAIVIAAWAYGRNESPKACGAALALAASAIACANLIGVATGILALLYRTVNPLG